MPRKSNNKSTKRGKYVYSKESRKYYPSVRKNTVTKDFADLRLCKAAMPPKLMNQMAYHDYKQNSTTTMVTTHIWAINSLHDPDTSGVGARPPLYNELYDLFDITSVRSCRIRSRYDNKSSRAVRVFFVCQSDLTSYNTPSSYVLQNHPGFIKYVDVGPIGTPQSQKSISATVNINSMFRKLNSFTPNGLSSPVDNQAAKGVNPAALLYLHVYIQALDENPAATLTYDYSIDFKWDVLWYRNDVPRTLLYD